MLVENFLQDRLVKLAETVTVDVADKVVRVNPICSMGSYHYNTIDLDVCEDFDVYVKNSAITSEDRLTPTNKKKAFEKALAIFKSNSYKFDRSKVYLGIVASEPYFRGELLEGHIANTLAECEDSRQYRMDKDTTDCILVVQAFNGFGYLILNLHTGKFELTESIDKYVLLKDTDIVFVKKSVYSILKKQGYKAKNVQVENSRIKRFDVDRLYDTQSGVTFTQSEYLDGAMNKTMLKLEYMQNTVKDFTNEMRRITDNIYCCARIDTHSTTDDFGQVVDSFDEDIAGLILNFKENKVGSGLIHRCRTIKSIDSESISCENNSFTMEELDIDVLDKLRVLNFDKIAIYNDRKPHLTFGTDNTLGVYLNLDTDLLGNYRRFPTEKRTEV